MNVNRASGRAADELRPLKVTYDIYPYAAGSTLFEMGNTKVLCSVTLQQGVPHFLKGKRTGWITAEYSMLPASTPVRTIRDVSSSKRSGRTIEISRLIGRALRSIANLAHLGENTLFIDCDVLQADGGTRTACIIGAYLALKSAQERWIRSGFLKKELMTDEIAAVSVGLTNQGPLLDMDYTEDSKTIADFNFVVTRSQKIIEIQGASELAPISWENYDVMRHLGLDGAQKIFEFFDRSNLESEETYYTSGAYVPEEEKSTYKRFLSDL